jgi:hypothetical protein
MASRSRHKSAATGRKPAMQCVSAAMQGFGHSCAVPACFPSDGCRCEHATTLCARLLHSLRECAQQRATRRIVLALQTCSRVVDASAMDAAQDASASHASLHAALWRLRSSTWCSLQQ